jgi:hypothetical protein
MHRNDLVLKSKSNFFGAILLMIKTKTIATDSHRQLRTRKILLADVHHLAKLLVGSDLQAIDPSTRRQTRYSKLIIFLCIAIFFPTLGWCQCR